MKDIQPDENCLIEPLVSAISGRWKLLIIYWLSHVEYSLTPLGQSLIPLLQAMHDWVAINANELSGEK